MMHVAYRHSPNFFLGGLALGAGNDFRPGNLAVTCELLFPDSCAVSSPVKA